MKPFSPLYGVALIALAAVPSLAQKTAASEKGWLSDLPKAMATAKKSRKLVLVDFTAVWCGPCQMYKKDVFPKPAFLKATKDLVLVSIDIDKQPKVARKFGVTGIPDIRFLTPAGKEVGRLVGFGGEARLLEEIKKARGKAKQ